MKDESADPETIMTSLAEIPEECRPYAQMALRSQLLSTARPLEDEDIEELLAPIAELEPRRCTKINDQMIAIGQ